jgi:hypothetical protein
MFAIETLFSFGRKIALHQEPAQPPAATRMAQSAQRLVLDLANALSREAELLPDLFARLYPNERLQVA